MEKSWYSMSESETCLFFDVDPVAGLSKKDALARLTRFGPNNDLAISSTLQRQLNTKVIRESNVEHVNLGQLVPGDIVLLEVGDRVPADIRLIQVNSLSLNQEMITGEVLAIQKNTYKLKQALAPEKQKCMAFAGSYVVSGQGKGIVVSRAKDTAIAKMPKKRTPKISLRNRAVAKRLEQGGVTLLNIRALKHFKNVNSVIIDAKLEDQQIIEIIRKIQLTKRIQCQFIVPLPVAARLAKELGVAVYDAAYPSEDMIDAQFLVNIDAAASVKLVSIHQASGRKVLWVTDASRTLVGIKSANVVLSVGENGRDDVRLGADLLATRQNATVITRILYSQT